MSLRHRSRRISWRIRPQCQREECPETRNGFVTVSVDCKEWGGMRLHAVDCPDGDFHDWFEMGAVSQEFFSTVMRLARFPKKPVAHRSSNNAYKCVFP